MDIRKGKVETGQGNHAQRIKRKLRLGGGRSGERCEDTEESRETNDV